MKTQGNFLQRSANTSVSNIPLKDREFADLYAGGPDSIRGNAARCYRYIHPHCKISTAETNGPRLLRNAQVQAYLHEKADRIQKETDINAKWLLDQSVKYLQQCMGELEVSDTIFVDTPDGKQPIEVKKKSFSAAGAGRALEIIGKNILVNAFSQKVEISSKPDIAEIMARRQKIVEEKALKKRSH